MAGEEVHVVGAPEGAVWKICFLTTVLASAQARKVIGGATGLIPSQFLEEKRKAFVRRDWDNSGAGQCTFAVPRSSLGILTPAAPPRGNPVY